MRIENSESIGCSKNCRVSNVFSLLQKLTSEIRLALPMCVSGVYSKNKQRTI